MSAHKQQDSHRPPSDGGMAKEEFIRVGTTLYKIVEQPKLNGGYVRNPRGASASAEEHNP